MKVTLDLSQLLLDGKITKEEQDRLILLSRKDTKLHAFAIFTILAAIAVAAGFVGLFPEFFKALGEGLLNLFGERGLHFAVMVLCGVGAYYANSGFLAGACAFTILTFIGDAGVFYTHAAYFVAIQEPGLTVLIMSALAVGSFLGANKLDPAKQRVAIIFSRTCIFFVNMAFWIGSLWGSKLGSEQIPDFAFAALWAAALIGAGAWAAFEDKRWVVNTAAVFGSIHFYTQWFERLGASPGSLLFAGVSALAILYGLRQYNRGAAKA